MRLVRKRIALSTAALMMVALPVLADDATWGNGASQSNMSMGPEQQNGKVECMLVAENDCARRGASESRIDRIQNEINKGTAVYTREELQILNNALDRAISERNDAYGGGG
jgi:hypothetical protein